MTARHEIQAKNNPDISPATHRFPPKGERGAAAPLHPPLSIFFSFQSTDQWGAALPYTPSIRFTLVLHL